MSTEICGSGVCLVASEFPNDLIVILFDTKQLPCRSAYTQLTVPQGHILPELLRSRKRTFPTYL